MKGSIKCINLIIRRYHEKNKVERVNMNRFDYQDEFDELCPFLGCLNRLIKLRIELPKSENHYEIVLIYNTIIALKERIFKRQINSERTAGVFIY